MYTSAPVLSVLVCSPLQSTWGQYHKGRLYLKQQLADMRIVSDLCSEVDRLIGQVEFMRTTLQTPPDMR